MRASTLSRAMRAACVFLAPLAPAAFAQVAERPAVRAGDTWQFVVYYARPSTVPNRTWVVRSVSPAGIEALEDGENLRLTLDLNPVDSPLLQQGNAQLLRFPLRVGMDWRYANDMVFKDNRSTARVVTQTAVTAYERVRVPAGEFDAFRLQSTGRIQGTSKGGPGVLEGESRSTYWYAPAARAIVRAVNWSTYRGESTTELVAYRLQP